MNSVNERVHKIIVEMIQRDFLESLQQFVPTPKKEISAERFIRRDSSEDVMTTSIEFNIPHEYPITSSLNASGVLPKEEAEEIVDKINTHSQFTAEMFLEPDHQEGYCVKITKNDVVIGYLR